MARLFSHQLLITTTVVLALIFTTTRASGHDGRVTRRAHRHWHGDESELTTSSRSMGGEDRRQHSKPFDFIVPLYRGLNKKLESNGDGHLTGFGLLIRNLTMLVHDGALQRSSIPIKERRMLVGWGENEQGPGWFGPTLNAKEHFWHVFSPGYYVTKLSELSNRVSLYRLEPESESDFKRRVPSEVMEVSKKLKAPKYLHKTKFTTPPLNSNVSLHSNCYVYSYSLPYGTKNRNNLRVFSRWPVRLEKCANNGQVCTFINDHRRGEKKVNGSTTKTPAVNKQKDGLICNTWHDVGAPVMCSSQRERPNDSKYEKTLKLSYLVLGPVARTGKTDVECNIGFTALRLADYYNKLKKS